MHFVVKQSPCKTLSYVTDNLRFRYVRAADCCVKERPFAGGLNADIASLEPIFISRAVEPHLVGGISWEFYGKHVDEALVLTVSA